MQTARIAVLLACILFPAAHARSQDKPKAEAKITGRVVDETGKPVAGAAVGVFNAAGFVDTARLLAKPPAVTAADGTYAITAGETFSHGTLVITGIGRQSCALQVPGELARSGGDMGETLLMAGTRLQGRVRDEKGAAFAGVRVRVESSITDRYSYQVRLLAGALSDEKGIVVVPGVPRTGLRLVAEADGYVPISRLVAHDSPLDLTMQKAGMVRGKVVDAAGAAVAGVTIHPVTAASRDVNQSAVSGADGSFATSVPGRGRFRLSGYESAPPHRQFSSGLLHGPADDVVIAPLAATAGARDLVVTVVDATTRKPLPRYHLSQQSSEASNLQIALFHHGMSRRPYEGKATLVPNRQEGQALCLVVDAEGHAFEVVPVPDDVDQPIEVALGPEAVLVGKVIDTDGKPVAGVAVRALPKGSSSGSGGSLDGCSRSDADGNYRIGSLRAGEYGVQTHGDDRPPSTVFTATVAASTETRLDLTTPKQQWLEFELQGEVPAGPAFRLSTGSSAGFSHAQGSFNHSLPTPQPQWITGPGRFKLGPVNDASYALQLFAPSRTRVGSGTTIKLGDVRSNAGLVKIKLPDLNLHLLQGRIELPGDVPSERIAVLATPPSAGRQRFSFDVRPTLAGVGTDGRFTIDLPHGPYCLQLADLLTGIVFHTEEEDLAVAKDSGPVTLKPACHWLEIECLAKEKGAEVVLQSFSLRVTRPRNGTFGALLNSGGGTNKVENGSVPFRDDLVSQRWLVPPGELEIKAMQTFAMLRPGNQSYRYQEVASAKVDVAQAVQKVTLEVPAPPSDEELLRKN